MEIFTNEDNITIERGNNILDLKIIAINSSNRDIPFIEIDDSGNLLLLLNPFNSFPLVPLNEKPFPITLSENKMNDLRYVKLEIKYTSMDPNIRSCSFLRTTPFINIFLPKKTSMISINGMIQPDISITMPLGWRMGGGKIGPRLLPGNNNKEGYLVGMKYFVAGSNKSDSRVPKISISREAKVIEKNEIQFYEPYITLNHGKRTYHYLIRDKDYQKIRLIPQNTEIVFKFSYISQISSVVHLISIIPFFFFFPIAAIIIGKVIMNTFNLSLPYMVTSFEFLNILFKKISIMSMKPEYALTISILAFSFFGVEYSMIREGFNIPYKYYHYLVFYAVIIAVFLIFYNCIQIIPLVDNATPINMI